MRGQVFEGLLQSEDSLGDFVQTEAVASLPLAFLVTVSDLKDHFGHGDLFALVHDGVLKYRSSHSADFEYGFRF